jgi:dTDP-4-amino-4,6-dideoxygalactose transaminase
MTASETSSMIPVFDLRFEDEDIDAVTEVLRSGWITQGKRVQALEETFARHLGREHAVVVSSGTAALHLAYRAVGVGPGDEVIVPSYTFVATANAALYCGASPVFAEIVGIEDPSLDPEDVVRKITPRTRAVAVVHYGGYAAPVDALAELCAERGIALVEDCAHAPSASLDGRKLGAWGDASCFSFVSNKVLAVGEGGLLATDDAAIAESARRGRSHCMTSGTWERHSSPAAATYDVDGVGFNYRLDEPRAALLLSRMARMEEEIARRAELTRAYRRRLSGLDGLVVPFSDEQVTDSSCYIMPVMVESGRDEVRQRLRDAHGVQTTVMYPAIHQFTAYQEQFGGVSLPRTERAARSQICLPLFPHMTDEQQSRVVAGVEDALGG